MIGDDIEISILDVKGNQVRIGINAPKEISVHRDEVYQRIKEEKQQINSMNLSSFSDEKQRIRAHKTAFTQPIITRA